MQKISDRVFAETGFRGCNPGFVVTEDGVVMIDTPQVPSDAVQWREEIAKFGRVRYLINTEPHRDHFSGNFFFEGVVVAHEGVRQAILATPVEQIYDFVKQGFPDSLALMTGYRLRPPDITFNDKLTLHVGGLTFELIHMPGHTPYQAAVYIPEERVVFTSDNVFGRVQAWLREAVPYQWLDSLKRLQALDADMLIPGHGAVCGKDYIPEMMAFIQAWIDAVQAAIDRGMSLEEAQAAVSLLDRYPMERGTEFMAGMVQRMNVERLYRVLKNRP